MSKGRGGNGAQVSECWSVWAVGCKCVHLSICSLGVCLYMEGMSTIWACDDCRKKISGNLSGGGAWKNTQLRSWCALLIKSKARILLSLSVVGPGKCEHAADDSYFQCVSMGTFQRCVRVVCFFRCLPALCLRCVIL
jgi:hypothetical protein